LGETARRAQRALTRYDGVAIHDTTDPDEIVVEFDVVGEHAETREPYRLSYIQVLRSRNGEIALLRDYWDPLALSSLLETSPASTGTAEESSHVRS
jgi:ketosteroid isomerase-like protein